MKYSIILCVALIPFTAAAEEHQQPGTHFIENWDLNDDGQVTAEELREKRSNVFYTFDSDENDKLTVEEYAYFDEARKVDMESNGNHGGVRLNKVQDGMLMTFNDVNADGVVSREEFLGQVDAWLASIDRTNDGLITTADFGPKA